MLEPAYSFAGTFLLVEDAFNKLGSELCHSHMNMNMRQQAARPCAAHYLFMLASRGLQMLGWCCTRQILPVLQPYSWMCRYGRLAKIPISVNRAIVNTLATLRLCPAGVKSVHDMLVSRV